MPPSVVLRYARHLSTTVASATKPTISYTKNRLKHAHDPDEALKIYASYTAANNSPAHPASTRYAQESTVRRLSKSHRFSDVETFLESHKSHPQITQEPFLSSLIRSYGIAGMFENALNTYQQMTDLETPRSSLSFNALLQACVLSKLFDRVPAYFNEFPAKFGFLPDKFSYAILIKSYCEMGLPEMAMDKLAEMEEKGIEIGAITFTPILHVLYKKGRSDDAEKLWDEMVTKKGYLPDVGSYNVRLMHIHSGQPEGVKELLEEMCNAGIKPDTVSHNYLMTCYCENGMMDEAQKVYDELLKTKGHNPNAATFRSLLFHLCKHGRFMTGYKVLKESVKARKIPDFNSLKYLAEGLVNKGHMKEAKAMIRTMNKKFPPDVLKAWGKLAEDLGLAAVDIEEVNSDQTEKAVNSGELEKANDK